MKMSVYDYGKMNGFILDDRFKEYDIEVAVVAPKCIEIINDACRMLPHIMMTSDKKVEQFKKMVCDGLKVRL